MRRLWMPVVQEDPRLPKASKVEVPLRLALESSVPLKAALDKLRDPGLFISAAASSFDFKLLNISPTIVMPAIATYRPRPRSVQRECMA
jgi:hypothetical protein